MQGIISEGRGTKKPRNEASNVNIYTVIALTVSMISIMLSFFVLWYTYNSMNRVVNYAENQVGNLVYHAKQEAMNYYTRYSSTTEAPADISQDDDPLRGDSMMFNDFKGSNYTELRLTGNERVKRSIVDIATQRSAVQRSVTNNNSIQYDNDTPVFFFNQKRKRNVGIQLITLVIYIPVEEGYIPYILWINDPWFGKIGKYYKFDNYTGKVTVKDSGIYLVYAQVTYRDTNSLTEFGVYVNNTIKIACISSAGNGASAVSNGNTHNCYTSRLLYISESEEVYVKIRYDEVFISIKQTDTFWGIIRMG